MRRRRHHALLIAALCVAAGVTCSDRNATGPSSGLLSRIGFAPALTAAATEIYRNLVVFGLDLDNVHLQLKRQNGEVVKDTVITIGSETEEIRVDLTVQLRSSEERFLAHVELRDGTQVLFSGTQEIIARAGQGARDIPPLEVSYTGPGANAASLFVTPSDSAIFTTDSIDFVATALDANEQSVPVVAIAWSVEDPTKGTVSQSGRFKPAQARGEANVIAKLPTGLTATAHVTITPVASQMAVVSGGDQSGTVGTALPQPIVVEVKASDNLPVSGYAVNFAVGLGGGSLSAQNTMTDANGRASTTLTLGTVSGTNTVIATASNIPTLTVSATARAGSATKLGMLQQPSPSVITGVALAVQPKVKLLDAFGNGVAEAGVVVQAAASDPEGPQLGGTVTATTDASGVATFGNLSFTGSSGAATIVFTSGTLASVTSSSVSVGIGSPVSMALSGSTTLTGIAGVPLTGAPSVIVTDAASNPVSGVPVQLTMSVGQTTVYDQTHNTDGAGSVSIGVIPTPSTPGSYVISATNASLAGSPIQVGLSVSHGDATQLAFIAQPSGVAAIAGALLSPILVELRDQFGNPVTTGSTSQVAISLSLSGGTTGAVLGPSPSATTQNASGGRATFNVSVDLAGTGYTLTASAGAPITSATSTSFDIGVAGSPSLLLVRGGEQGVLPREPLPDSVVVRALDANGNPIVGGTVTFAIDSGGGTVNDLPGPVQVTTDANGLAGVAWTVGTGQQRLTASTVDTSAVVRSYVADRIVMVTEPSTSPQSGVKLVQQPRVRITDGAGHLIQTGNTTVEVELVRVDQGQPSGSLAFEFATTDADGLATFTDLAVSGPISEQVALRFFHSPSRTGENPEIAAALSVPLTLQPGLAMFVIPAEFAHRLAPTTGNKTLTFTINDGFNPVPAVPVQVDGGSCALSNVPTASDAAGQVSVDVTAGAPFTSCRVILQVNQAPFFATNWQRVYSVAVGIPLWAGGKIDDPDPASWDVATNWFDGMLPDPFKDPVIFIPASVDEPPRADRALTLQSLHIETGGMVEMNGQPLTVSGSLLGGGFVTGGPGVTATATTGGTLHAFIEGLLKVGEKDTPLCSQSVAYTVATFLSVGTLELNCPLVVDTQGSLFVQSDMVVNSASGGLLQGGGGTAISRDALFNFGVSRVFAGGLSVGGKLFVAPNATFDQFKGTVVVEGDATFNGSSRMQDGLLRLNGSMFYSGNGDNPRFFASLPHTTQFGATVGTPVIGWTAGGGGQDGFGRLEVWDRAPTGYSFSTGNTQPFTLRIEDLYVAPASQLTVPSTLFTIVAGTDIATGAAISGRGVVVESSAKMTNNGTVTVASPLQSGCSPLPRGDVVPKPYLCTNR